VVLQGSGSERRPLRASSRLGVAMGMPNPDVIVGAFFRWEGARYRILRRGRDDAGEDTVWATLDDAHAPEGAPLERQLHVMVLPLCAAE
jgi:hypothetical protein